MRGVLAFLFLLLCTGSAHAVVPGCAGNGTTDDTVCLQNAINANQNGTLYLDSGIYRITSGLTSVGPIHIVGGGGGGGNYITTCTAGIRVASGSIVALTLKGAGSVLSNTCFDYAVTATGGSAISVSGPANSVTIEHVQINGAQIGIDAGNTATQLLSLVVRENRIIPPASTAAIGIRIGAATTQANTTGEFFGNEINCYNGTSNVAIGMQIQDSGGSYFGNNDIYGCSYGTVMQPGTNQQIIWSYFVGTVLGDSSLNNDLFINTLTSSSAVLGNQFVGTWASSGAATNIVIQDTGGSGNLHGLHFVGHRSYSSSANSNIFDIRNGDDITIDSSTICSVVNNSGVGVNIRGAAGDIFVRSNRIGRCDTGTGSLATGVSVTTSNQFVGGISGNDFASATNPISYLPSGGNQTTATIETNSGPDGNFAGIAAASTIALPVNSNVILTTSGTVSTINGGWSGRVVHLYPAGSGGATFITGGNVCNALTVAQNVPVLAVYDGGSVCWHLK